MLGYSPLVLLTLAAQIYFGIHAVRTGRTWWLFIILFFPGLGCLIYFLAEYLPEMRAGTRAKVVAGKVAHTVTHTLDPGREIRDLEARVKITPSFANRHALADAYLAAGRFDDAIARYTENTQGVHAADPATMRGLAHAWYAKGDMVAAREYIEKWRTRRESSLAGEMDLLYAKVLENLGEIDAATTEYLSVARRLGDFESWYKGVALLKARGKIDEAKAQANAMETESALLAGAQKREARRWLDLVEKELK